MSDFSIYGGPSEEWLVVEKTLPNPVFDLSLGPLVLRKAVNDSRNKSSAEAMEILGPKVRTKDFSIPTRDGSAIEARTYRPVSKDEDEKLPVYLYFHGGGFLFGDLSGEDGVSAQTATNVGVVVVNVNYRHTPEHTFPTAWNDSHDAFVWLHQNIDAFGGDPDKVVVGGVSAGGQLTASLVLEKHLGKALQGLPEIAGQILLIPALAHVATYADGPLKQIKSPELSSSVENEFAPILPKKMIEFFTDLLKTGLPDLKDTKVNIVNASPDEVKGLPPTAFGIAGFDPLRDEGLLYAKLLSENGVPTETTLFKGVPHGHRRFGPRLKASAEWDKVVEQGILWAIGKPSATGKFEVKVV